MWKLRIALFGAICALSLWPVEIEPVARGREVFENRCTGCHSLDSIKVGPPMRSVFGRRAASYPGFPYSDSLKRVPLVWDEASLEHWLADPEAVAPDNDMGFRLSQATERSAVIAYLRQLAAKRDPVR